MASPFEPVTDAIKEHLATWDPGNADEAAEGLAQVPEVIGALNDAIAAIAIRLSDKPGMTATTEGLLALGGPASSFAEAAEEVHQAFRAEHAFWLGE